MVRKLFRHSVWLAIAWLSTAVPASAQQKMLTLDDIYGPAARVAFSGTPAPAFAWIDGDHYAWPRPTADRGVVDWMSVNAATGAATPLFDAGKAESAVAALPGMNAVDARRSVHSRDLIFNGTHSSALLTIGDDLYLLTFADARAQRVTSSPGEKDEATLSPDGSTVGV